MVKKAKKAIKSKVKTASKIQSRFGKVKRTGKLRNLSGRVTKKPSKA